MGLALEEGKEVFWLQRLEEMARFQRTGPGGRASVLLLALVLASLSALARPACAAQTYFQVERAEEGAGKIKVGCQTVVFTESTPFGDGESVSILEVPTAPGGGGIFDVEAALSAMEKARGSVVLLQLSNLTSTWTDYRMQQIQLYSLSVSGDKARRTGGTAPPTSR